ncbi:helix-turn-helix domain-containing protein [Streptomyces acidicola]|uniref:helix-turn-helix domain-containing protein n=1 Tax=Streptomyces acidicola TaxID=2596892 RepID=UPI0034303ECD
MGRPENPLTGPPHRRELARYLRMLRASAQVTYEEMAECSKPSAATLKRTASGATVPRRSRVLDFSVACLAATRVVPRPVPDAYKLSELWLKARMEERGTLRLKKPRPEYIADQADLSSALYALYEHAGAPPLREVQARAGGAVHLPLSTLARIVSRDTLPADERQLLAFLTGCGVEGEERQGKWRMAWTKVSNHKMTSVEFLNALYEQSAEIVSETLKEAADATRLYRNAWVRAEEFKVLTGGIQGY